MSESIRCSRELKRQTKTLSIGIAKRVLPIQDVNDDILVRYRHQKVVNQHPMIVLPEKDLRGLEALSLIDKSIVGSHECHMELGHDKVIVVPGISNSRGTRILIVLSYDAGHITVTAALFAMDPDAYDSLFNDRCVYALVAGKTTGIADAGWRAAKSDGERTIRECTAQRSVCDDAILWLPAARH